MYYIRTKVTLQHQRFIYNGNICYFLICSDVGRPGDIVKWFYDKDICIINLEGF